MDRDSIIKNLQDRWRQDKSLAIIVFMAAMAVRLVFIGQWHTTPYGDLPLLDAQAYDKWAQNILNGAWLHGKAFYQSPLYPYVLAVLYGVFGHSFFLASLFNTLLDSATCALLSCFAFRSFGPGAGILTGFLAVFYGPFIFHAAPVTKESLALFLLTLFLISSFQTLEKQKLKAFFISGLWLGIASLARSNFLLLGIPFLILAGARESKKALKGCLLFLSATALTILPATLHNAWVSHDFVPVNSNGGFNFYVGNSPGSNGANIYPPGISSDPSKGEERDTALAAQAAEGRKLLPSEVSRYWFKKGTDYLIHNPDQALILFINKVWLFWDNGEHPDNYDINFIARNFDTLLSWPLISFSVLSVLAAFTAVVRWKKKEQRTRWLVYFALTYMLSVILFYVTDRYRLPVVVFLLPLAGASFSSFAGIVHEKRWARMSAGIAFAALFLWMGLSLVNRSASTDAHNWGLLASLQAEAGKDEEAIRTLQKGLALSPHSVGPDALIKASFSAERLGRRSEAERLMKLALDCHPEDGSVQYHYGRLAASAGDLGVARIAFEQATLQTPWNSLFYFALALVEDRMGQREKALAAVKSGLAADPSSPELNQALNDLLKGRPMRESETK